MNLHKLIYSILIGALCWSIVAAADNYVIINQVMYDTPENEIPVLGHAYNGEFIELYNAGTSDVALNGWQLHGGGSSEVWTFSTTDNIPAGGYLIVSCRRGSGNTFVLSDLFDDEEILPANSTIIYQNKIILNNDGETITLCNAANDTIDMLYYDGESHQTDPYRLHAENATGISGSQCVSLHRTWVEFDEDGIAITGTSQWQTASVLFGRHMLPYDTYQETSLFGAQSLPDGENYVLSVMPLDPTSRIDIADGRLSVSSGVRMQASLTYMDGIGRQEQTIAMRATPGGKDIVSAAEYNGKRKPAKQWLPVVLQTEGQRTHVADLKTQAQTDYGDSRPFVETQYESSAQGRPTKRYQAGETYGAAAAENIYDIYDGTMDVRIYTIVNDSFLKTTGANYAPQTLYKTTTRDEDGKSLITYTDKSGRTVMEQRGDNQIYYVYDETGRLRYILPHNAQSKLTNGEYGPDNAVLRAAAYYYQYDARGNMIYKRLPGCEPQYMVYDQTGQLVLKQDGNQRAANKWTLCAYDSIGRNLYVAELPLPEEHSYYIDFFADRWAVEHYGNNHSYPLTGTGYASSILGKTGLHLLTVNYYDDYNHLNLIDTPTKQALSFKPLSGYDPQHDNAIGMLTGTRVYNLSDDNYTITAYYYDAQGRVVQSRSTRNAGGVTATSAKYHFDGTVAQRLVTQGTDSDMVSEHYRYLYDHTGRTKNVYYRLNNDAEIILSAFSYDSIGRLVQNLLHNSVDTVRYSYDMRNMLTETRSRHFSEGLFYADNLPEEYVSACYNGSISAVRTSWADTVSTFAYSYDPQNRLLSSNRVTHSSQALSERFTYDPEGNILSLKRYSGNRKTDDLSYSYGSDGNRLISVVDNGQDADLYSTIEYHYSEAQADTTMCYDANGNLIRDLDRGITVIKYNILNLPDTILFANGNRIINLYDAAGCKYKSIVYTNIATAVTSSYDLEHAAFEPDSVEYCITEYAGNIETIYTPRDTTRRIFNTIGYRADNAYYYFIKDHLGNICAVVNATADTVVQRTMYYASGVPMAQSWGRGTQPYMYNGKELVEAHGWNTYDYGFRGYYAPIARFTSIDPLAEQTPWQSPYAYAGNNFINVIDWMGLGGMYGSYNLTCVNGQGVVVYYDFWSTDHGVYRVDDDWTEEDLLTEDMLIGWEIPGYRYAVGEYGDFWLRNGDYFSGTLRSAVAVEGRGHTWQFGFYKASDSDSDGNSYDNAFRVFSGEISTLNFMTGNPLMWGGANGNVYNMTHLRGRGSNFYLNSYNRAIIRGAKGPLGVLGTGLSVVSLGNTFQDMRINGVTAGNTIEVVVDGAGIFGGVAAFGVLGAGALAVSPYVITAVTIYGVADFGVYLYTGHSIADWVDE